MQAILERKSVDDAVEKALDDALVYKNEIETQGDPVISDAVLWYGLVTHNSVAYTDPRTFRSWHAHVVKGFEGLQYKDGLDAYYKVKERLEAKPELKLQEFRQAA